MITPAVIQVLFWIMVVIVVIVGLLNIANRQAIAGLLTIILGPLVVRIYCELIIVAFRILDGVNAIAQNTGGLYRQGPPAQPGETPFGNSIQ
jgi:spore maturation protein SpmA